MQRFAIKDGRLLGVRRCPSPNHDARPPAATVDTLVVHGITLPPGRFGGGYIDALFANRLDADAHPYFADVAALRVSAHALITRTGVLTQYVNFDRRAWHAGRSCFGGRGDVNDFAIGVELEGTDDCPYTPAQYAQLGRLSAALLRYYPGITRSRIVGHSDIAPGRKTDPGPAFDWSRFDQALTTAAIHFREAF